MNNFNPIDIDAQVINSSEEVYSIRNGTGSPVILIHGLAASLFDWKDLIPELTATGYSSYALDLLGHGKSRKPKNINEYNMVNVYEIFSNWIDKLKLDQSPILLGHSLGGYLAIRYSLTHPNRVSALVLCDPFYSMNQLPWFLQLNYQYSSLSSTLIELAPEWIIRQIIDFTSLSIRNGYTLPASVRKQTATDYKRAEPGIFNLIHTIQDLTPQLSAIIHPTFVLWGEKDRTLATESFTRLLDLIPNSTGFEINGAGHVPHQSHPFLFNQQVLDFLHLL